MSWRRRAWWQLGALLLGVSVARAHNPETSYARVLIQPATLELRLTYDLFTLQKIAAVDANADGQVTAAELQAAAPALQRFLQEHVLLDVNGVRSGLGQAGAPEWPRDAGPALAAPDWHSAASLIAFPFRRALSEPPREVGLTFKVFEALGTRHNVLGVFLSGPTSEEVAFTQEEPDYLFDVSYAQGAAAGSEASSPSSDLTSAGAAPSAATPLPAPASAGSRSGLSAALFRFFKLGMAHILLGYDHLCFLLALLVVSRFRDLVKIVTSFTVAHTITLILAALGVVHLPPRLVECAVAATIVYVAAENLFRKSLGHRWRLTFCFGLIHGFGFAGTLLALGLPTLGRIRCLLSFNVGVEAAQLALLGVTFPLLALLHGSRYASPVRTAISIAIALFGLHWFATRAFNFSLFPV